MSQWLGKVDSCHIVHDYEFATMNLTFAINGIL